MRKFLIYCTLFTFLVYWAVTFLYVAPKNPIFTPFFKENQVFGYFFGQKWALFAPPPKDNKKLYYTFYSKQTGETRKFEVLESFLKLKTENAPFSVPENIRDHILSNSGSNIIWWSENYRNEKVGKTNLNGHFSDEELLREKMDFIRSSYYFQLLKSYSVWVAEKYDIPINDYEVSFSLARIDIPDFADREKLMEEGYVFPENILFESEKFSIAP